MMKERVSKLPNTTFLHCLTMMEKNEWQCYALVFGAYNKILWVDYTCDGILL